MTGFSFENDMKKNVPWTVLFTFFFFSVGMMIIGVDYYRSQRTRIYKEYQENLSSISSLKLDQINQWRNERIGDAEVISKTIPIVKCIREYFRDSKNLIAERELRLWMKSLTLSYDYNDVTILDTLFNTKLALINSDSVSIKEIKNELLLSFSDMKVRMTDLHRSNSSAKPSIDIIIPVTETYGIKDSAFGIIILRLDPEKILFPLIQSWPTPSKSAETLIIRRDGDNVLYLNDLKYRSNTSMNLRISAADTNLPAAKAINGFTGIVEGIDYRKVPVVGYVTSIKGFNWFMVAKIDKGEIETPLKAFFVISAVFTTLLILIIASVLGYFIWNQRIKLNQIKLKDAEALRDSEERFNTAFRMSPVTVTITRQADNKFIDINNTFLHDLGFRREEVIGKTARELGIWGDENEREWVINELRENGKIFGKTLSYRTKSGKLINGLTSMSVIQLNGEPCNLATVVNNTESYQAEEKIKQSEELYSKLFHNMLNGFAYCKMLFDNGKPNDFIYLSVNRAFESETGLKNVTGKKVSEVIPGIQNSDPGLLERYSRVSLTGNPEVFETYVESLKMWFMVSVYSPQKEYFVAVFDVITARKHAEEHLRETNQYLSNLFNYANAPIMVWDTALHITQFNHAFENLSGYFEEEVLGKRIDILFPEHKSRISLELIERAIMGERLETVEIEIKRKDNDTRIILWNSANIMDRENKTVIATIAQGHDITERKKIEKTLKESEEKFRKAFLTNPDSITITSLEGKYLSVNNGFTEIFGYSAEEVLGKTSKDISIWEDIEDRKYFTQALETKGNIANFETGFISKNGKKLNCLVSATIINLEGISHVLSTTRDITERKLIEEALADSEERFRSLYENVTIGMYRTTVDGKILLANPTMIKMMGFDTFEQLAQRNLEEEGYEPEYPRTSFHERMRNEGRINGLESAWYKKNGDLLYVRESANAIMDANGNILYYDGTVEDITERKKAEEALRESEDKFKYVFDHSVTGKSITLPTGEISVNSAFCEMIGYTKAELTKSKWQEISYPDDIELTNKMIDQLLSGEKKSARLIKRYVHKNGSVIWADVGTSLRRDSEGKPLYFMTSVLDITDRKKAEEALRFKNLVFDASIAANSIADTTGKITEVNDAFLRIWGFREKNEVVGLLISEFLLYESEAIAIVKALNSHGEWEGDYTGKKKDGSTFIAHGLATVIRNDFNQIVGYQSSVLDITDRKSAEELLIENERMLRESQEIANVGTYNWNLQTGTWSSSKILDKIFGINENYRRTLDGWVNLIHPDWQQTMNNYVNQEVLGKRKQFDKEYMIVRQENKKECWVHGLGKLEFDNKDNPQRLIGTIIDITERKNSERKIKNLNEELEQRVIQRTEQLEAANKELEAFSYSVSHDLRAPLRAVNSYTNILLEDYEKTLDDEGKRICKIISSSATQMGELIDDLLSFSRIGRGSMTPALIDMRLMAVAVFNEVNLKTSERVIKFKVSKLNKAIGDGPLIKLVWTNLISNALKYTSRKEKTEISIGSEIIDGMIVYHIKDNGVGFDKLYSHKLFGVFQRLHTEKEFEGNGVGLAIVQRIINKHGGKVWADGEVDKGAIFYFSLPAGGGSQKVTGDSASKAPDA